MDRSMRKIGMWCSRHLQIILMLHSTLRITLQDCSNFYTANSLTYRQQSRQSTALLIVCMSTVSFATWVTTYFAKRLMES